MHARGGTFQVPGACGEANEAGLAAIDRTLHDVMLN